MHFLLEESSKIFVLLVLVVCVMGWPRAMLSPERVREFVRGKPAWLSRTARGSTRRGHAALLLVIVSFLIADPMINVVAVVLLSGIVGWQSSTLYVAGDLVGALFGCILMQRLRPERWVEDYVWQVRMGDAAQVQGDTNPAGRHRYALEDVRQSVSRIWKWVLACNALGGMFHGYARHGRVSGHLDGHNRWSVPLAVTLYSDTTGVIPIALAMLDKGVMLGAALALPEMLILRKIIPWPALALYSTLLAASFTLLGWASNPIG